MTFCVIDFSLVKGLVELVVDGAAREAVQTVGVLEIFLSGCWLETIDFPDTSLVVELSEVAFGRVSSCDSPAETRVETANVVVSTDDT